MLEALGGGGASFGAELEHWYDEGAELIGLARLPLVLVHQNVAQRPHLQLVDVSQLASFVQKLSSVLSLANQLLRKVSEKFDDQSNVIFVARVVIARMRFKQEISRQKLKSHASSAPYVSWRTVATTEQDLDASVLTGLYVLSEMSLHPASVPEIGDLDFDLSGALGIEEVDEKLVSFALAPVGAALGGGVAVDGYGTGASNLRLLVPTLTRTCLPRRVCRGRIRC